MATQFEAASAPGISEYDWLQVEPTGTAVQTLATHDKPEAQVLGAAQLPPTPIPVKPQKPLLHDIPVAHSPAEQAQL